MARGWREMANAVDGEVQRWRSCWFVCPADHPRRVHGNGGGTECSRTRFVSSGVHNSAVPAAANTNGEATDFSKWVKKNLLWTLVL